MGEEIWMENIRIYGDKPFNIAVIHGGPGAPGTMAPLARELSKKYGVIEPMQTADSIEGQLEELKFVIECKSNSPVVLIGHSWGAWLSYMFASKYPRLVKKLVLVGCGSFEEKYLTSMNSKRENRLTEEETKRVGELFKLLNDPHRNKDAFSEFGKLMTKADSFEPISLDDEGIDFHPQIFQNCMREVNQLRKRGELLEFGKKIECPIVAIHGEYDSHSYEGVEEPLSKLIKNFKFHLLKDCGHSPWNEVHAKNQFYEILCEEL